MRHHHIHHVVDSKTISKELHTVNSALEFLIQADLFVRLDGIAAANGITASYLIGAANSLIESANIKLAALPHGAGLASAADATLVEDLATGSVTQATAVNLIDALNATLRLPAGALFEFPNAVTFLNVTGTAAALHRDHQINQQLSVDWNQPINTSAFEIASLPGDFQHYLVAGFSPAATLNATTNDILSNHVA